MTNQDLKWIGPGLTKMFHICPEAIKKIAINFI
jgi:hypothetical protein